MKDNLSRYTLRIDQTLLDKLGYIAEYTDIRFILMDAIQHAILRRIHCCGIVITDNSDR